ncbi:MAG: hypothetical protein PHH54_01205 [Candidatus Nanoarchaeia archaeon]|nr:hypothetical protein [Candidatus Nanoarchaeia archaeon]MDD5740580.1 hypothetical protein [Candidatus Nanoarchaeia archaeon]
MRYQRINENLIEIIPEENVLEVLLATAKKSYDTATPRGKGQLQPHQTPSMEVIFDKFIKYNGSKPVMLLMDYVNGRDCRTKVFLGEGDKWYFDCYAFGQRGVTSEEFLRGVRRDNPEELLNKVSEELSGK